MATVVVQPEAAADVRQLLRYCRVWSQRPLTKYHYLIGKRPRDESGLRKAVEDCQFEIKILYIAEHIPTLLAWDEAARRYVPYDSSRYASDTISLIF